MDLRTKLTIPGLFALLGAFLGNQIGWVSVGILWLILTFAAIVAIIIESPKKYRPHLATLFEPQGANALYQRLLAKPAHWPRDWRMYDWSLRVAVSYVLLMPLFIWVFAGGHQVAVGALVFLPEQPVVWWRIATTLVILLTTSSPIIISHLQSAMQGRFQPKYAVIFGNLLGFLAQLIIIVTVSLSIGAGGLAICGALIFAITKDRNIAATFLGIGAANLVIANSGGHFITFAILGFIATFGVVTSPIARKAFARLTYVILTTLIFICLFGAIYLVQGRENLGNIALLLLFFGFLPLTNAVFDYISYSLTFGLLRDGLRANFPQRVGFALLDLAAAFAIFYLLGLTMIAVLTLANHMYGGPLYPLAAIFADIRAHPQANYWIFGMLFSTLLPTLAHGAIVSFSAGSLLAPKWRAKLHAGISSEDTVEQAATMLGIGLYASFSLLAPLGFLWVLYWLFAQAAPYPFLHYLNALEGFAAALK